MDDNKPGGRIIGSMSFSADEWADMEQQREALKAELRRERGEAWYEENEKYLNNQWEGLIFNGFVWPSGDLPGEIRTIPTD